MVTTITYLDARVDEAFRARELGLIFDFDQDEKVQIMPHVVLDLGVLVERHGLVVELGSVEAAYEARISERVVFFLLLLSQITESIDDDTKNQVEGYNDDNEEEQKIVDNSEQIQWLLEFTRISQ